MNVFYRSTAFTIISVCFQGEEWGDTKDGGGERPELILDRLDKYLLRPCREPDLMMTDQKMKKRRRRRRTNDLEEGEGFDDESREATLRHPSLGGIKENCGEGAKVHIRVWQFLLQPNLKRLLSRRPIRGQRTETIARRCSFSAIWRCTSRSSASARKGTEMQLIAINTDLDAIVVLLPSFNGQFLACVPPTIDMHIGSDRESFPHFVPHPSYPIHVCCTAYTQCLLSLDAFKSPLCGNLKKKSVITKLMRHTSARSFPATHHSFTASQTARL
jgi:hypothetical protein